MTQDTTEMTHYSTHLHKQFVSREQRNREEKLCNHYRAIGIPAVAAAKCVRGKNGVAKTWGSRAKQR